MGNELRMTVAVLSVLRAFLEDVDGEHYGIPLMKATGLPSGTLYPSLARLEANGWLLSYKEDIDPVAEGRPPRRYYKLNPAMADRAHHEVDSLARRLNAPAAGARRPGLAGA